jgi:3-oxoacyl-[acyl-carrier-protein] synthase-1/3-oxoacyl-[acyl-carrier-protein] synthase II
VTPVAVIASAAISALGRGRAAYRAGVVGDAPVRALALEPSFDALRHPLVGRARALALDPDAERAEQLLTLVTADLVRELDAVSPDWRSARLAVVLGTSSGGMQSIEAALRARSEGALDGERAARASYTSPLAGVAALLGGAPKVIQVLAACASSTLAIGLGCRLLDADRFDLVIAGGYDALSALVASGFDALGALTRTEPQPFRAARDGMALGEGAGLVALSTRFGAGRVQGVVLGFGASSDAHHVTAPDPEGEGLARAALLALEDAATPPDAIGLVSAHGTGTVHNDAAEARSLARVLGGRPIPLFPFKAVIGHTLGAGGVLETLATLDALGRRVVPAVPGAGALIDGASLALPSHAESLGDANTSALKLSAAFGGANAALVVASSRNRTRPGTRRPSRPVALVARGPWVEHGDAGRVARFARVPESLLARVDAASELVLTAVARLFETLPSPPGPDTAVVVGTISASLEQDELFDRRRRSGLSVEPRRFPATSPNLGAGWCTIAFDLRAASFAVSDLGAADEALTIAHDLVAWGDATAALAVRAEDAGPVVADLFGAAGLPVPQRGAEAVLLAVAGELPPIERSELGWGGGSRSVVRPRGRLDA